MQCASATGYRGEEGQFIAVLQRIVALGNALVDRNDDIGRA
jgi:hypothetical protein